MTTSADNKRLLQAAFAALERGDGKPFIDCMADEFTWRIMGTTPWSRTYSGKAAVRDELFKPLFAQFADRYSNTRSISSPTTTLWSSNVAGGSRRGRESRTTMPIATSAASHKAEWSG